MKRSASKFGICSARVLNFTVVFRMIISSRSSSSHQYAGGCIPFSTNTNGYPLGKFSRKIELRDV